MNVSFQLCGAWTAQDRSEALIMILFTLLFLPSRAPNNIYELMKMFSVEYGVRADIMHALHVSGHPDAAWRSGVCPHPPPPNHLHPLQPRVLLHVEEPLLQQERLLAQHTLSAETEISREREAHHQESGGQGGTGYGRSDRGDLVREVQPMIITLGARQPMGPQMQQKPFIPTGAKHTDLLPTFYPNF